MWAPKRGRLDANVTKPPSEELAEAAEKVRAEQERYRKRAERFGVPYVAPSLERLLQDKVLSESEWKRLTRQRDEGEVTGFDPTTEEEVAKRASRAARFGTKPVDYEEMRRQEAGLGPEVTALMKEREKRAQKFGKSDSVAIALARAAYLALEGDFNQVEKEGSGAGAGATGEGEGAGAGAGSADGDGAAASSEYSSERRIDDDDDDRRGSSRRVADDDEDASGAGASAALIADDGAVEVADAAAGAGTGAGAGAGSESAPPSSPAKPPAEPAEVGVPRPNVLHLRAYQYLPAATADISAFFSPLRPSYVEWLNAISINVHFADKGTAARALERLTEPIPVVTEVPPVPAGWRMSLKPLVKLKSDRYAPAGAETTVYLRQATTLDTKARAAHTAGPRKHGTFSKNGMFSRRAVQRELRRAEADAMDVEPEEELKALVSGGKIRPQDAAHVVTRVRTALTAAVQRQDLLQRELGSKGAGGPDEDDGDVDVGTATLRVTVELPRGARERGAPMVRSRKVVRETVAAAGAGAAAGAESGAGESTEASLRAEGGAADGGADSAPAVGSKRRRGDDDEEDEAGAGDGTAQQLEADALKVEAAAADAADAEEAAGGSARAVPMAEEGSSSAGAGAGSGSSRVDVDAAARAIAEAEAALALDED
jgi:hypothetical protein